MLNAVVMSDASPVDVAASRYPVPTCAMPRFANVATPPSAAIEVVPDKVAPLAPVPGTIATAMDAVDPVTVLPKASRTATCGAGDSVAPALPFAGETVTASATAAPGVP